MAEIDFPDTPSDGDEYANYVYSSSSGWNKKPPAHLYDLDDVSMAGSPTHGTTLEYDIVRGWGAGVGLVFPVGGISVFAGATPPSNYLLCDGSVVARSLYPKLFQIIGTTYNTGAEASTDFRLPNLNGRVAAGADSFDTNFGYLGRVGGSKTHTLTVNEMPSHTHIQDAHTHTQNSHSHTQDSHNHGMTIGFQPNSWEAANFGLGYFGSLQNACAVTGGWDIGTTGTAPNIANTTAVNLENTATNQNTGGGLSHTNLQPYISMKYIIRFE